jgi:phage gp29-like protein
MSANLAKLAQLTPVRLSEILRKAETGDIAELMDLCDRMITTDGGIRANYETRIAAIAGAAFVVEAGSCGDPARDAYAERGARFVTQVLEGMRGGGSDGETALDFMHVGFGHAVTRALDAIGKGLSTLEIPWENVPWQGTTSAVVPRSLVWVHQRRFRWHTQDSTLRLIDDGETRSLPGVPLTPRRWIVHCPPTAGAYPWVSGVLRTVAWCYLFKRWCRQFWVMKLSLWCS